MTRMSDVSLRLHISRLTMIFVLIYPAATFLGLHHELVVSKASIDEGIDKRAREIGSRGVNVSSCRLWKRS